MANYHYHHARMRRLLRLGPWVDLAAMREEILGRLKDLNFQGRMLTAISSYEKGEAHTLPQSWAVQDEVSYAFADLYEQNHSSDPKYYDAIESVKAYFTTVDYWVRSE